jgi:hypothetical protein
MVSILLGFASITFVDTRQPRNLPFFTLKTHFFWVQLEASFPEVGKCFLQIGYVIFLLRTLDYDVINICQDISANLGT